MEQAKRNLEYATIYAPIDGIVVERDVEVGQTVAASLSAPRLFLIAGDLRAMQILASVDEADIGQIREGQPVRFLVQAHGDTPFAGTVRQVRLQSTAQENVVNYTVVIDVDNTDGRLLPGMTATVDFVIARAEDVLRVPNAALRFRPTEAMLAEVRERGGTAREAGEPAAASTPSGDARTGAAAFRQRGGKGSLPRRQPPESASLWYVDAAGALGVARVRTGITDGQHTEVAGEGVTDGLEVITGVTSTDTAASGSANPFQQSQPQRGRRPPGGF
jgi:HlyD family secretion protein